MCAAAGDGASRVPGCVLPGRCRRVGRAPRWAARPHGPPRPSNGRNGSATTAAEK